MHTIVTIPTIIILVNGFPKPYKDPHAAQFNIPLPFGNIGFIRTEDGKVEISSNEGFSLFGYGAKRNVKVIAGNGTFHIEKGDSAIVNGSEYGGSNTFEFSKERGIDLGTNLTVAGEKAMGGLGKDMNFLEGLLGIFQKLTEKNKMRL